MARAHVLLRWLRGPQAGPPGHRLCRWLFLRALALASLCACLSLASQWRGLFGSRGIAPATDYLASVSAYADEQEARSAAGDPEGWLPGERYLRVPSLAWLGCSDAWLQTWVLVGVALSLLLLLDLAPGPAVLGLWAVYLSLCQVGGIFFRYQWDGLLIEGLFCALWLAPWRLRPRLHQDREPSQAGIWLLRLLVFKLMLLSGWKKWLGGDPSWQELSALSYHFWTQPLPTWAAWYAARLPDAVLALATAGTLAIEAGLPVFVLGPRRLRHLFGLASILLMLGIGLSGNFGFFNLLSAALCLCLFDDRALRACLPARLRARLPGPEPAPGGPGLPRLRWLLAAPVLLLSLAVAGAAFSSGDNLLVRIRGALAPFRSCNAYGLFVHMTTERPEIELQGSEDGRVWLDYRFRYKPSRLEQAPAFAGPHMPRLDWQMWFAALQGFERAPWLRGLMRRLLEAEPSVLALLAEDPFPGGAPRYLRARLALWRFSDAAERARDGVWWVREEAGAFGPTVTLVEGRLRTVR